MHTPLQKILYGPPGSGKSTKVRRIADERGISASHIIETTFHPDYTYGDFVAKIMPTTLLRKDAEGRNSSVIRYQTHVGPFIKALALALRSENEVLLVIDEINRGNGSAIFGDIFQLLDRADTGRSVYGITLSELVFSALMKEFGWTECEDGTWVNEKMVSVRLSDRKKMDDELAALLDFLGAGGPGSGKLQIPANLSILATMNTSDESVYMMDTAFKRRWAFEFIPWDYASDSAENSMQCLAEVRLLDSTTLCGWHEFLGKLNAFITRNAPGTRLEDKLVGLWFIKAVPAALHDAMHALKRSAAAFSYDTPQPFLDEIERQKQSMLAPSDLTRFGELEDTLQQFVKLCTAFEHGEKAYAASTKWNALHAELFNGNPPGLPDEALWELNNCVVGTERWHFSGSPAPRDRSTFKANRGAFFSAIIDLYLDRAGRVIPDDALQYKLLHFVWDNIFYREKTKLATYIGADNEQLRTFDQFLRKRDDFLRAVMKEA